MSDEILDGVRIDPGSGPLRQSPGGVTYSVLPRKAAPPGEKRTGGRLRTRLRSGKVLTPANKFLIECLIHDVSDRGARLRLPEVIAVPNEIRLYRDDDQTISVARVVWRKSSWVGVEFVMASRPPIRRAALSALGGKYYGIESDNPIHPSPLRASAKQPD